MKSINFVILGDNSIAGELGKKGTTTDISIYDKKMSDSIYTFTVPLTYPEKLPSLIQAINMSEYAILNITRIDKNLGEQIIALDSLDFKNGFILHSYDVDEEKIRLLIRNTSIKDFKFVNSLVELKQEFSLIVPENSFYSGQKTDIPESKLSENSDTSSKIVSIDHAFDVKGVGTVVLGVIKQGIIRVHDQLQVMPADINVTVKSIQMHDTPVEESTPPARVGLALKGITADKLSRGDLLCSTFTDSNDSTIKVFANGDILAARFKRNSFFKGQVLENEIYMLAIGLQIKPAKIKNISKEDTDHSLSSIEIVPEKPIVYFENQIFLLLKLDTSGIRIVGQGIIT
ncbi:MAG TPA: EF-Tu/IF-2/RF-3 family GTPase [Nitrososphaeraceae archaeon]